MCTNAVLSPDVRTLDDLDLLRAGVLHDVRIDLPPAVAHAAREAGALEVVDPEGVPLARYDLAATSGDVAELRGTPTWCSSSTARPFEAHYLDPESARAGAGAAEPTIVVDRVLTQDDHAVLREQAPATLLVLAGPTRSPHNPALAALRSAVRASEVVTGLRVVAVPLSTLDDRPGHLEAVLAAYAAGPTVRLTPGEPAPSRGTVLFFTGLSGSGKSTIARAVHNALLERSDEAVTLLDGDLVRRHLSAGLTFSPEDREINISRIGWVAAEIAYHGGFAICSPIAPYAATREQVRALVTERGGRFLLVHVATPLTTCEGRDRKGLYAKARAGQIPEFTGVSAPYEVPSDADLVLDTTQLTVDAARDQVLALVSAATSAHALEGHR